jgi:serine/threonine-protein phosphatase 2A regulatory subunit A
MLEVNIKLNLLEALSENLLSIAPLVGSSTTTEHIVPMFLILLKDEHADVRLPLLKNLEDLHKAIGVDALSHNLVPAITQLAAEKKWRVRLTIIEYFPILAKIMGETSFTEKFGVMCLSWLDDNVFAIR